VRLGALVTGRSCDVGQMLELRCDARFAVRGWRLVAIEAQNLVWLKIWKGLALASAPLCSAPPRSARQMKVFTWTWIAGVSQSGGARGRLVGGSSVCQADISLFTSSNRIRAASSHAKPAMLPNSCLRKLALRPRLAVKPVSAER
jgi:hypothetical protein